MKLAYAAGKVASTRRNMKPEARKPASSIPEKSFAASSGDLETSAGYSRALGRSVAFAYVKSRDDAPLTDAVIACPDPHCGGRFRIIRETRRMHSHSENSALPLDKTSQAEDLA